MDRLFFFRKDITNDFYWNLTHNNFVRATELLNDGHNIDARVGKKGRTMLMKAIKEKHSIQIVQYLIDHNIDVNIQDKYGDTALIIAVRHKRLDVMKCLHSANMNLQNKEGNTALIIAANTAYDEGVQYLVESKADINKQNYGGYTALMYSAIHCNRFSNYVSLKALLHAGANMYLKTNENLNIFHLVEVYCYNNGRCSICVLIILHNEIIRRRKTLLDHHIMQKLVCPICGIIMNDAVISKAGESYCRKCIDPNNDTCELIPNVALNNIIHATRDIDNNIDI